MTDETPADGIRELRALTAALTSAAESGDTEGLLGPRGGFPLGETVQHAAQSIRYAMEGYPKLSPAVVRHSVGHAVKKVFLRRGAMRHNLAAPVPGAPELDPNAALAASVAELRDAVERLAGFAGELHPHPVYGRCTVPQAASLQAMHLREHLPGLAARVAA
ncbi:DUF1569 domain-containing protein [Protaetiibacter intestinalis]|uniref:DUF1569 domain-containing protein n=1 Tax=Protaetiibacter intestinalis TaxID=2419774 RepID=A0A387B510_9MICO|nr:DUF1569 domain-containing protein [Protaetiibacter intestinalis]AYF98682.1 DUF1569 domain-containing protein [Protaetiibacter intestinalis]